MYVNNTFLLLEQTGVGKSTLIKILSEDTSIKIGNSRQSETKEVTNYKCTFQDFNYSLIDTPGYDDSNGNDPKNYAYIKKVLASGEYKIKGILLLISFQDARFGESHRKGLEKIVNLFPLDNFWDYITIVFTKTFCEDDDDINQLKDKTLKDYKEIFDTLISAFNKTKNIKIVNFSSIQTLFINSKIKKHKKDNFKELISILKKNSKLDPFFHTLKVEEKWEQLLIKNKDNQNLGDLFDVKFKVYQYYNEKGEIKKSISKPIDKKFIKKMERKVYTKFQKNLEKIFWTSFGVTISSMAGVYGLRVFCPPISLCSIVLFCVSFTVCEICVNKETHKRTIEKNNKEFDEKKVINEILIEEEECEKNKQA